MTRCETLWPLKIISDVTLRNGSEHVEVTTVVNNDVLDHRVRVLFPTNLKGDTYHADATFDVVERPVALAADNNIRRELDVETRPQQTWTSFGDGQRGLAIVSRGQPESAVTNNAERAIALTLFRGFRRAVISNDNPGGQIQGKLTFRYAIVPFAATPPINELFLLGQRIHGPVRSIDLIPLDLRPDLPPATLPPEDSFLHVSGDVVVTSLQQHGDHAELRFFNPHEVAQKVNVMSRWKEITAVKLDDTNDDMAQVRPMGSHVAVTAHAKRIVTLKMK
jgi:alpha-mannosidase